MSHKLPRWLSLLLAGSLLATAAAAAPAGATEGPVTPAPPVPGLPSVLSPPTFTPPVGALSPAPSTAVPLISVPASRKVRVRSARIAPKRTSRGRRPVLRMRLSGAQRVRIIVKRGAHRVAVRNVRAGRSRLALRLPAPKAGRYRVSIVAADGHGTRSLTVSRTYTVKR